MLRCSKADFEEVDFFVWKPYLWQPCSSRAQSRVYVNHCIPTEHDLLFRISRPSLFAGLARETSVNPYHAMTRERNFKTNFLQYKSEQILIPACVACFDSALKGLACGAQKQLHWCAFFLPRRLVLHSNLPGCWAVPGWS